MSEEDGEKQQPDADTLARELLRDYPVEEILARLTKNEAQITMMMNMTEKLQKGEIGKERRKAGAVYRPSLQYISHHYN